MDMTSNSLLPPVYHVYTDGSAIAKGTRTGAWAAVIVCPDGTTQRICGSAAPTTISRMEMMAAIMALERIAEIENGPDGYRVKLFSDSEFVVQTIMGRYERRANLRLWAYWDEVARDVDLFVAWSARNVIPKQALCDELAGQVRRLLADHLAINEHKYATP